MSRPITLWRPTPKLTSDDAHTSILTYGLPARKAAPYNDAASLLNDAPLKYVPPLSYFCIKMLVKFPEQLDGLGPARLRYTPPNSPNEFDILQALIPSYRPKRRNNEDDVNLNEVDPRLWAVLIQLYTELPQSLRTYQIPLGDIHFPLLQEISCTPHFALISVLEFPGCSQINDNTIVELRSLHGLVALDVGRTAISSWGVRTLAKTLVLTEEGRGRNGPWGLRILSLLGCHLVDKETVKHLRCFPLLSVVDLRETSCPPGPFSTFLPSNRVELFYPAPMTSSLSALATLGSEVFSHPDPFLIYCNTLSPKATSKYSLFGRLSQQNDQKSRFSEDANDCKPADVYASLGMNPECIDEVESDIQSIESETTEWQNAKALHEEQEESLHRAALRFYGVSPSANLGIHSKSAPERTASRIPKVQVDVTIPANADASSKPNPYTLYRPPPPWSILYDPQKLRAATGVSEDTHRRKRVLRGDGETSQVKQSALAKKGVRNVLDMVQRRTKSVPSKGKAVDLLQRMDKDPGSNPFLRSVDEQTLDCGDEVRTAGNHGRVDVPDRSVLSKSKPLQEHVHSRPTAGRSAMKPISALPIPNFKPLITRAGKNVVTKTKAVKGSGSMTQATLTGTLSLNTAKRSARSAEAQSHKPTRPTKL